MPAALSSVTDNSRRRGGDAVRVRLIGSKVAVTRAWPLVTILNGSSGCYTQTQRGAFHDAIRKSIFYPNVDADRGRFDRDGRNESPERPL